MSLAQVNGTEIWYSIEGTGHPLILCPGLGMDHQYYRLAVPLLAAHAKVILLDPRGIGQSRKDSPKQTNYTPELWADDFAALARQLNLAKVDILGSSLGGAMAMSFAEKYPEHTRSLIVIGGFSQLDRALEIAANVAFLHTAEAASASMGVAVTAMDLQDVAAIEPAFTAFAHEPNGGLILAPNPLNSRNTEVISGLAARLHLPAIYPFHLDTVKGGLVSYGFDTTRRSKQHRYSITSSARCCICNDTSRPKAFAVLRLITS